MKTEVKTPQDYLTKLVEDRKTVIQNLMKIIKENIPNGFEEGMQYGMIAYFVPHSIYPDGYHCKPKEPLPFLSLASQKNSVNLYHMGLYLNKDLFDWFVNEYPKYGKTNLDIGKSCIRFKKLDDIPYQLIGKLVSKITVNEWIHMYEKTLKK